MTSISIVIPLFNKRAFITATVLALAQQLQPCDEIIVIDDVSTDDGPSLVEGLQLAQVRLLRMEVNSGPGDARNRAAHSATGEYLIFFDADDVPHRDLLLVLRQSLLKHPDQCLFAYGIAFQAHGEVMKTSASERDEAGVLIPVPTTVLGQGAFVSSCLRGKPMCIASSTCVRAREFKLAGGFQMGLRYCEDTELWARMSAEHCFVRIERTLALYRDVPMSLSHGLRSQPGSVQPYVESLLALSQRAGDEYQLLARSMVTRNTMFSVMLGARRVAIRSYLKTIRPMVTELHYANLRLLTLSPRVLLRIAFALRARWARVRFQLRSMSGPRTL